LTNQKPRLTRRAFVAGAAGAGIALTQPERSKDAAQQKPFAPELPGNWPIPHLNRRLTSIQPLAEKMAAAPEIRAKLEFLRNPGALSTIPIKPAARKLSCASSLWNAIPSVMIM